MIHKEISEVTLFISAEAADGNHVKSLLAQLRDSNKPVVSIVSTKAREDAVSERFTLVLGTTGRDRAEIYQTVLSFVSRFDVQQILLAPVSAVDSLIGIASTDITGAPMALFLSESTDLPELPAAGDLICEAIRKSSITFTSSELVRAEVQKKFGKKAWIFRPDALSGDLSQPEDYGKWIRQSSILRRPIDHRFENLFDTERSRITPYVDPDPPGDLHWEFHPLFQFLTRLQSCGYEPDFVIDVGASSGYWSHVAAGIYSKAVFVLIEPLLGRYLDRARTVYDLHPEFICVGAAAGAASGEMRIHIYPDLYGSSFFDESHPQSESELVPVKTLDEIAAQQHLSGRGILKIDVQFGEHLVLEGAQGLLERVDFIILETSLKRFLPGILTFSEMIAYLQDRGFRYFDQAGGWRDSLTGELLQEDVVVARHDWQAGQGISLATQNYAR